MGILQRKSGGVEVRRCRKPEEFNVVGTVHHLTIYTYINQQDAQDSVIRLHFPLDALHVSDYISPFSGATFISCTSHLVYADTIRLAVV